MDSLEYYQYLKTRSGLAGVYRRFYLYPKLKSVCIGTILDVGCGLGDFLDYVGGGGAIGCDTNELCVNHCLGLNLPAILSLENKLPFKNNSFETVVLDNVLEHIGDPFQLLEEIKRVTSKRVLVGVPQEAGYNSDPDHKVFYDRHSLEKLFIEFGFRLEAHFMTPIPITRAGRFVRQNCLYAVFDIHEHS